MPPLDCAAQIADAFAGRRKRLTDEDIAWLSDELKRRFNKRREKGDAGFSFDDDLRATAKELADDIKETARIEKRNAKLMNDAKERLLAMVRDGAEKWGDISLGLRAALVGTNKPLLKNRLSVDSQGIAIFDSYFGGFLRDIETAGLAPHLNTGAVDIEIARALEKLTRPDAKGSTNQAANKIAEIIHKWRGQLFDRQNRAGAWNKELSGYITTQNWDSAKLQKAGFEKWRKVMLETLDHERTFGDADPNAFLEAAFQTLITGRTFSGEADLDLKLAFKGPANLAKRVSQHRKLHFKDADHWVRANEAFGLKSMRESIIGEFMGMSRHTAMMETFGPNPGAVFDAVKDIARQEFPDKGAQLDKRLLKAEFDVVAGHSDLPVHLTAASVNRTIRGVISMASLHSAVISSVADFAAKAARIRYTNGGGVLTPFAQSLTTFVDGLQRGTKREVADRVRAGLDGMMGGMSERFMAADAQVGSMARALRLYFKANLLTPWTDTHKRGLALFASRTLAAHAKTGFDRLPEHMRYILNQYDIDAKKWDVIRKTTEDVEGTAYLLPDKLRDLDDNEFTKRGLDPVTDKDALETAVRAFFIDTTEYGVPTPGARERAIMTLGYKPGTIEGEALRYLGQFKQFPVTVLSKVWGNMKYANPGGEKDKVGMAVYMASSILLGYAAMSMKDIVKGRKPRDPLSGKTLVAAFMQGGGAGIYGDFLFGEYDRYGRSLLATVAGPTAGRAEDLAKIFAKLRSGVFDGEVTDVTPETLRFLSSNIPNVFYTKTALDYLVLYQLQEMSNPGYLRRTEQRLKRDQDQEFLITPPSQAIPYGGGNRIFEGVR